MPRTVIYDLKGGFGSLRKINALYEVEDDGSSQGLWLECNLVTLHDQSLIRV
jgi:hypothetical protein